MAKKTSHFMTVGIQPDPCPDLCIERGADGTGVGPWVPHDKHRYLCEYLWATRHAWSKWPNRVFLDPFCGPGRIQVKGETGTRDGGVVTAWRESKASGAPFSAVYIGDKDPERLKACALRLEGLGAPVRAFTGPASDTIPLMTAEVPRGALCFAYIDPYNLSLLSFDIFKALSSLKVDIAAHFSTMDLLRNVVREFDPSRNRFDDTAPGWRSDETILGTSPPNLPREFLRYWQKRVEQLGYQCSQAMPLIHNSEGRAIYRLVFFARSYWPLRIWKDVANSNPQQSLLF